MGMAPRDEPASVPGPRPARKLMVARACAECGASPDTHNAVRLAQCSRCNLTYFCSKDCQHVAWRSWHKTKCRAPGEFRKNDRAKLKDLKREDLNGAVVYIRCVPEGADERLTVFIQATGKEIAVKRVNLQILLDGKPPAIPTGVAAAPPDLPPTVPSEDCPVCFDPMVAGKCVICTSCAGSWCNECQEAMQGRCPLCRGEPCLGNVRQDAKRIRARAKAGSKHAQYHVAIAHREGHSGFPADQKAAAKWFRRAAEQGHASAQYNLATVTREGRGVQLDAREAVRWYRTAAEQGHSKAMNSLGVMYVNGDGMPSRDAVQASRWYRAAADRGSADAQNSLGLLYLQGDGVPQDYALAIAWFEKSAAQGFKSGIDNLAGTKAAVFAMSMGASVEQTAGRQNITLRKAT